MNKLAKIELEYSKYFDFFKNLGGFVFESTKCGYQDGFVPVEKTMWDRIKSASVLKYPLNELEVLDKDAFFQPSIVDKDIELQYELTVESDVKKDIFRYIIKFIIVLVLLSICYVRGNDTYNDFLLFINAAGWSVFTMYTLKTIYNIVYRFRAAKQARETAKLFSYGGGYGFESYYPGKWKEVRVCNCWSNAYGDSEACRKGDTEFAMIATEISNTKPVEFFTNYDREQRKPVLKANVLAGSKKMTYELQIFHYARIPSINVSQPIIDTLNHIIFVPLELSEKYERLCKEDNTHG